MGKTQELAEIIAAAEAIIRLAGEHRDWHTLAGVIREEAGEELDSLREPLVALKGGKANAGT